MSGFGKSVIILLLALWMPATMHCRLEVLPQFSFLVCCDHDESQPHQDSDCDQDACATVESGFCRTEDNSRPVAPTLTELPATPVGLLPQAPQAVARPAAAGTTRPDLATAWQFELRAAPNPRAPSPLS